MKTRSLLVAALAAVAILAFAACGGGGQEVAPQPAPSEETAPSDEPAPPEPPEPQVQKGGILRVGTTGTIDSINPFVAFNAEAYEAFVISYPILVEYGPDFGFVGDWAESWEISPDGLVWTFRLKPGQWSDGAPLTSGDALWTAETVMKYAKGPTALLADFLDNVDSVAAPDEQTFVITYATPVAQSLVLSNLQQLFVLPAHVWSEHETDNGKGLKQFNPQDALPVVGAGPFVITKYDKKGVTIFEKNPNYYGDEPNVDAVGFQHFENEDAMMSAFEAGELEFLEEFPPAAVESVEADERFVVSKVDSPWTTNLIFNSNPKKTKNRELLDPKVREAFAHAINRQEIADVVFRGNAEPAVNIVTPYSGPWFNSDIVPEAFDIDLANQILDDLGYAKGSDGIRVVPATAEQGEHKMEYEVIIPVGVLGVNRSFEIIQTGLEQAGVKLVANPLDETTAFEEIGAPDWEYLDFDLSTWSWVGYYDPSFVLSVTTCDQFGGWSDTGYCNPEWDTLYDKQGQTIDERERIDIVWEMQEIAFRDKPYIHLVTLDYVTAWQAGWTGFHPELIALSKQPWITPGKLG